MITKLSDDSTAKPWKPSVQNSIMKREAMSFCPKHGLRGNTKHHYLGGLSSLNNIENWPFVEIVCPFATTQSYDKKLGELCFRGR